jgi:hypothetical protein
MDVHDVKQSCPRAFNITFSKSVWLFSSDEVAQHKHFICLINPRFIRIPEKCIGRKMYVSFSSTTSV